MDQASASPAASCARDPAVPRTSSSCSQSADRSRTGAPPPARSVPQSEPHAAPSNRDPRPSSLALCRFEAKGYLPPEFYSGATGMPGRFSEGLLLRRLHPLKTADRPPGVRMSARSSRTERAISQNWIGDFGLYEPTGKMIDKAQSSPRPKIVLLLTGETTRTGASLHSR